MKRLITILLISIPLFTSKADTYTTLIIVWAPGNGTERVFYPDSLEYLNDGRVNVYMNGKIYNVDRRSINN